MGRPGTVATAPGRPVEPDSQQGVTNMSYRVSIVFPIFALITGAGLWPLSQDAFADVHPFKGGVTMGSQEKDRSIPKQSLSSAKASASASASASSSNKASSDGCRSEASASAEVTAGEEHAFEEDHDSARDDNGNCHARAESSARATTSGKGDR